MRKSTVLMAWAVWVVGVVVMIAATTDGQVEDFHQANHSVVRISADNGRSGAGFVVGGKVVTASHVLDGANKVFVTRRDGEAFSGIVVLRDDEHDIGVCSVPMLAKERGLNLAGNNGVGSDAYVIGPYCGMPIVVMRAFIGARVVVTDGGIKREFLFVDGHASQGTSGSPIVNARGSVVGMVQRGRTGPGWEQGACTHTILAVPVLRIKQVLSTL